MTIGVLQIDLFMPNNRSLKGKRMVIKSLKTRLRNNFNVAVSELDHQEKWQRASIGIVSIGNEKRAINSMLAKIVEFVERERNMEIIDYSIELL